MALLLRGVAQWLARLVWDQEIGSSILPTPTQSEGPVLLDRAFVIPSSVAKACQNTLGGGAGHLTTGGGDELGAVADAPFSGGSGW